jgi:hypothetical protein
MRVSLTWPGGGLGRASRVASLVAGLAAMAAPAAKAVPSFAVQTGQPCQKCHVGGLGPQLTPFGREFKLHGYTARVKYNLPLAVFAQASFNNTAKDQAQPPAPGVGTNNIFVLDQVSLFIAGGLGQHFGAFIQNTYDGIGKSFSWDNADIRAVTTVDLGKSKAVLGLSLNNNPTVQDAFNTLPAWGFPYIYSAVAPTPAASPLIGGLAQTTIGLTAYAWIDSKIYVELGGYKSPSAGFLTHAGADPTAPGNIDGIAPYGRFAYQWNMGDRNVEVGAFVLDARLFPGHDQSTGLTDHYDDLGLDASYQYFAPHDDVFTVNARYTHEEQRLNASTALGLASHPGQTLDDIRVDASYYWRNKVGFSVQVFDTWGSPDDLLYQANRRRRPDSSGLLLQVDETPFGNGKSPLGPRFNLRVGLQYATYFTFDGAHSNIDFSGRNAPDNNTFRIFTWIYF